MKNYHKLPFEYDKNRSFLEQLGDWIGDVFYDLLPEAGFDVRDEQIFMAFQLERAFAEKKIMFSEAGVGTGKTIAYLLYAISYARYMRKPAIIACADEALIEQLVKPEGDIAKLSKALGMEIDVRLAKAQSQYLCVEKFDRVKDHDELYPVFDRVNETIPSFVHSNEPLQSFYHYGDRKTYPDLNDEVWEQINWDPFQDCSVCEKRHRCGMTLTREYYRHATDLIICSQDFYMEHIWTYESRKRKGQLPFLPEASCTIFDEGHLLEFAAQKALAYHIRHDVLEHIFSRLFENDVREQVAVLVDEIISRSLYLFEMIKKQSVKVQGSERRDLPNSPEIQTEIKEFKALLTTLEDELVFESELYTIDDYQLKIVEEHIEMLQYALALMVEENNAIKWVTDDINGTTLVIMPNLVEDVLKEKVFSKKIPYIFSSATLSVDGDFTYLAKSLGIDSYLSFSVASPFDYEENMQITIPELTTTNTFQQKVAAALTAIEQSQGRTLLLFNDSKELQAFKEITKQNPAFQKFSFLFEGDQELSTIVQMFQNEEETCLCALHLWEGLDIPGRSLSNVIIWELPFPPNDPVYNVKRKLSDDPYNEVDLPYMLLRLRQGIGRLIRTNTDQGTVVILDPRISADAALNEQLMAVLPVKHKLTF